MIADIQVKRDTLKKQLTISIQIVQKDPVYNPVFSTLAEILENYGYSFTLKDSTKLTLTFSTAPDFSSL